MLSLLCLKISLFRLILILLLNPIILLREDDLSSWFLHTLSRFKFCVDLFLNRLSLVCIESFLVSFLFSVNIYI